VGGEFGKRSLAAAEALALSVTTARTMILATSPAPTLST
jgi:hypothetical protein